MSSLVEGQSGRCGVAQAAPDGVREAAEYAPVCDRFAADVSHHLDLASLSRDPAGPALANDATAGVGCSRK
ncbi:hypothetical protein [Paractinoplanes durhamensis]|uniref:Uncharacterized protein n=1 Tax=Paractinoplanes durhamensis TaxID=113563 RepID=A0ABQ3ZBP6_9ACTN|nr:hypothetical protein [Actinoplanes durhamensis]GIE07255.1 hypothetical protein Adu01nite_86050 [Actinoplanes durhamensis]